MSFIGSFEEIYFQKNLYSFLCLHTPHAINIFKSQDEELSIIKFKQFLGENVSYQSQESRDKLRNDIKFSFYYGLAVSDDYHEVLFDTYEDSILVKKILGEGKFSFNETFDEYENMIKRIPETTYRKVYDLSHVMFECGLKHGLYSQFIPQMLQVKLASDIFFRENNIDYINFIAQPISNLPSLPELIGIKKFNF